MICSLIKVRTVLILFRRSLTKNDQTIQKYTVHKFGKALPLILDSKTRWSSLHTMLEHEIENCICKSFIDHESKIEITDKKFDSFSSVVACFAPVTLAVEELCRNEATLLSANTILLAMVNNLGDMD